MTAPRLLLVGLLGALVLHGCECDMPGPDAGPGRDGGIIDLDSGEHPPDTDGGDPPPDEDGGVDAGGPDPAELARELCLAYARGHESRLRHLSVAAAPPARCLPTDPLPEAPDDDELPAGTCAIGDEVRQLFFTALTGGRVALDADAFRACVANGRAARAANPTLADLEQREAAVVALVNDADCAAAVTPLVTTAGTPCQQAWDCATPLRCEASPIDGAGLTCVAPAAENERCDDVAREQDLAVRTCADGLACVLGLCTTPLGDGDTCTAAGVPCAGGLACLPTGLCGAPQAADAPCTNPSQCQGDLVCAGGLCAVLDAGQPLGGACGTDSDCATRCVVCRPDGSDGGTACALRGADDEPCAVDDDCQAGLFCDPAAARCASYASPGAACGPSAECASGFLCTSDAPPTLDDAGPEDAGPPPDGGFVATCTRLPVIGEGCIRAGPWTCGTGSCVDGVCRAGSPGDVCVNDGDCTDLCVEGACTVAPREGAPCTADDRCAAGLLCNDNGRCLLPPGAGEPCAPGQRCGDGAYCTTPPDAGPVCQAQGTPGETCTDDDQCLTGRCLDTGTCSAQPASCLTSRDVFAQLVGLSLFVPLVVRLRRRRRAPRA